MDTINQETFDFEIRPSTGLTLVVFSATWCRPCTLMAPILDKLDEQHEKVKFVKIDIEASEALADEFEITSVPTFMLYSDGAELGRKVGMQSKKEINEWLTEKE